MEHFSMKVVLVVASLFIVGCAETTPPAVSPSSGAGDSTRKDEQLYRKGTELLETEPEKAIDYLTQSLEISPHSPPAIYNRAVAYARVGRDKEAVADVVRLEKVNPKLGKNLRAMLALSAAPYTDLGNAEYKAGHFEQAIVKYDSALAYSPGDPDALVGKGLALKQLGKLDEALKCYSEAAEVDPKNYFAFVNRAALHQAQNRPREALADYTKAIELSPDDAEAYAGRSTVYAELKMPDEALRDNQKAEELKSSKVKASE